MAAVPPEPWLWALINNTKIDVLHYHILQKYETQSALFKDPTRTAKETPAISVK
jgi:hypothetical protein